MKKFAIFALVLALMLSMVVCGTTEPVDTTPSTEPQNTMLSNENEDPTQPTPPTTESQAPADSVESSYAYGPDEMIIAKVGCSYEKGAEQIDGKDVYVFTNTGWTGEIWANATSHMLDGETLCTPGEVREVLAEKQIKYCAITFQLSEEAQIGVYHAVPVLTDDFKGELVGFILQAGGTLAVNGNYLDVYADNVHVYSNGAEVKIGDPINANQWYTVVCELLMDTENALYGNDSFVNVALTNGNDKPVYIAGVTYYTDDSFKTDLGQ